MKLQKTIVQNLRNNVPDDGDAGAEKVKTFRPRKNERQNIKSTMI